MVRKINSVKSKGKSQEIESGKTDVLMTSKGKLT